MAPYDVVVPASGIDEERIVLLGGGGHASDVLNVIERLGWLDRVEGCLDDEPEPWRMRSWGIAYLGTLAAARLDAGRFVLGVGMPDVKAAVLNAVDVGPAYPLTLIDPGATVSHRADLEAGTVVLAGANVSPLARMGRYCSVSQIASIGHDAVLGDLCSVLPGATVSGGCQLGSQVLIGANAVVLQGISIGMGASVGAGAVVTRDVRPGATVMGSPAREMTRNE